VAKKLFNSYVPVLCNMSKSAIKVIVSPKKKVIKMRRRSKEASRL